MTNLVQHRFSHHRFSGECHLICPQCRELLTRHDIEHFHTCPYCDTPIEFSRALEDFILQPAVNHWLAHQFHDPGAAFLEASASPPPE